MKRKLKPIEVGKIEHTVSQTTVIVFYDRDNQCFFGQYADMTYSAGTETELRPLVIKAIEESLNIEWTPVIQVKTLAPFASQNNDDFIGFRLDRFWIGKMGNGHLKKAQWREYDPKRLLALCNNFYWDATKYGAFSLPSHQMSSSSPEYYLLYDEPTWDALQNMLERIRELRKKLHSLFLDPASIRLLLGDHAMSLLPEKGATVE